MFGLILYSDRKSKEPFFLMILCLISGIFTITLAMFIQNFIVSSINTSETLSITSGIKIFLTSSIEEYCKLLALYLFFSHLKSFDDIYDGFVYSAIIALSFAGIETVVVKEKKESDNQIEKVLQDKSVGILIVTNKVYEFSQIKLEEIKQKLKIPLLVKI